MDNSFFDDEIDNQPEHLIKSFEDYLNAKENGTLESLNLNEEEFDYVIDKLCEQQAQVCDVLEISQIAFSKLPYSSVILGKYCDALILNGNPNKAIDILNEYKDSFTTNSSIYFLLTRAYIAKNEYSKAKKSFKEALSFSLHKNEDTVEIICAIALDCLEAQEFAHANYYFKSALKYGEIPSELACEYAFCLEKENKFEEAIEYNNKYLDFDPFNSFVWFNLGTVYAKCGNFDSAIVSFEYSIALKDDNSSAFYNLGMVYLRLERYVEASKQFLQAIEIGKNDSYVDFASYISLAEAYMKLSKYSDANDAFSAVLNVDNNNECALAGRVSIMAIESYLARNIEKCKQYFSYIIKHDTYWLDVIYDILPNLKNEQWYINLYNEIQKN